MKLSLVVLAAAATAAVAVALEASRIAPFSAMAAGAPLGGGWRELRAPGIRSAVFTLVRDGETTVLRVRSDAAAGSVGYDVNVDARATPMLSWRWKVDRVVASADMSSKAGEIGRAHV